MLLVPEFNTKGLDILEQTWNTLVNKKQISWFRRLPLPSGTDLRYPSVRTTLPYGTEWKRFPLPRVQTLLARYPIFPQPTPLFLDNSNQSVSLEERVPAATVGALNVSMLPYAAAMKEMPSPLPEQGVGAPLVLSITPNTHHKL